MNNREDVWHTEKEDLKLHLFFECPQIAAPWCGTLRFGKLQLNSTLSIYESNFYVFTHFLLIEKGFSLFSDKPP